MDYSALPEYITQISVYFTNDREIHSLNQFYRKKDKPTDVLSFSQLEAKDAPPFPSLGDIIISLDTAFIQAKQFKVTKSQEVLRLLIHGTLHLLGYEHEKVSAAKAATMRRLEQKLYLKYSKNARLV